MQCQIGLYIDVVLGRKQAKKGKVGGNPWNTIYNYNLHLDNLMRNFIEGFAEVSSDNIHIITISSAQSALETKSTRLEVVERPLRNPC